MKLPFLIRQVTIMLFLTMGVSMEMIGGTVDMTFAAQISASTLTGVFLITEGLPLWAGCLAIFLFNAIMGCIKGICCVKLRIPSIIVTLAFQTILTNLFYVKTENRGLVLDELRCFYREMPFFCFELVLLAVFIPVTFFFLEHTYYGKYCRMLGENLELAQKSGLDCLVISVMLHLFVSVYFSIPALLLMFQTGGGSSTLGTNYLYQVLAAVFLGGIRPHTGRGKLSDMIFGALAITVMLILLTVSGYLYRWEKTVEGGIILLSLAFSRRTEYSLPDSEKSPIEKTI